MDQISGEYQRAANDFKQATIQLTELNVCLESERVQTRDLTVQLRDMETAIEDHRQSAAATQYQLEQKINQLEQVLEETKGLENDKDIETTVLNHQMSALLEQKIKLEERINVVESEKSLAVVRLEQQLEQFEELQRRYEEASKDAHNQQLEVEQLQSAVDKYGQLLREVESSALEAKKAMEDAKYETEQVQTRLRASEQAIEESDTRSKTYIATIEKLTAERDDLKTSIQVHKQQNIDNKTKWSEDIEALQVIDSCSIISIYMLSNLCLIY